MSMRIGLRMARRPVWQSTRLRLQSTTTAALRGSRRYASGSAATATQDRPQPTNPAPEPATIPLDATNQNDGGPKPEQEERIQPKIPGVAPSSTLNPPASTRPPPLDLPAHDPNASLLTYLFALGKAYTKFYRTGFGAIFTNRRLLREVSHVFATPPKVEGADPAARLTRAAVLLRERTRHDLFRLPLFGLVLLICGEFTPLLVLIFPRMTPFTCRIPRQIATLRAMVGERRAAAQRQLGYVTDEKGLQAISSGHVVRTLGLGSSIWDKAGFDHPFAGSMARRAVRRIVEDDFMIRRGGGVEGLEGEEVVIACDERGMDVRGKEMEELRRKLEEWVHLTTRGEVDEGERMVRRLLMGLEGEKS